MTFDELVTFTHLTLLLWVISSLMYKYKHRYYGNKIFSLHKMLRLKKVEYNSQEIHFKVIILQWLSALVSTCSTMIKIDSQYISKYDVRIVLPLLLQFTWKW